MRRSGERILYPFQSLRETNASQMPELTALAKEVIESGRYLQGPRTKTFEACLASKTGTLHSVGTSNGLDSIRLIFRGWMEQGKLKRGDKVALPAHTFIASVLPLLELGLEPHLLDIDPATRVVDFGAAARTLPKDVKGMLAVHLYGTPSWDAAAAAELRGRGVLLAEDNAQSIGAAYLGPDGRMQPCGSLGDASAISFYPGKNIGALGDAGAVCTDDAELAELVRELANYGSREKYVHETAGYNSRIDELQAAFLTLKLAGLEEETQRRQRVAESYLRWIRNPKVGLPAKTADRQAWHQFTVTVDDRDGFREWLIGQGVETAIHYPRALFQHACLEGRFGEGRMEEKWPHAARLVQTVVSLPIANLSEDESKEIAEIINRY